MRNFILFIFIFSSFSVFSQVNIINRTSGGFEILPEGIRGNLPVKSVDSTNIALGTDALRSNANSHRNIAIGNEALRLFNLSNNDLNTSQIAIGHGALKKYNPSTGHALGIAIGKNALGNVTNDARDNIVIGHFTSENNRGDGKIVIGHKAMSSGSGGTDTDGGIYIGNFVVNSAPSSGAGNVVIGTRAMFNGGQYYNTILGEEAGYGVSTASNIGFGNVMLGFRAGKNSTEGNKLYIENSDSTNTLIGGDFVLNRVGVNRTIAQITSTNRTFQVEGSALISDVLQLPLGAGSGKYLKSDGSGNATWATLPSFTLSLPYSGGISSPNTAFSLTNSDASGLAFETIGNIELKNINEKTGRILFSTDDKGNAKWGEGACISKCSFSLTRDNKSSVPSGSVQFLPFTIELFDICTASNPVNIAGDNDFHSFTAPYDGIYQFDFVGSFQTSSAFALGIYTVNSSNQPGTQLFSSLALASPIESPAKFTAILQLTAGQKIAPTVHGASNSGSLAFNNSDNSAGTRFLVIL